MERGKQKKIGKKPMEKALYVKAPKEFMEMLNQSQWYLQKRPAQIVREAVIEYLERHLPKEVKEEILKKGR
jgi:hypothetical protein